jgi:hypothetical protein
LWREYFKGKKIKNSERRTEVLQQARTRAMECIADLNLIIQGMDEIAVTETEKLEQYATMFTNDEAQRLMANVFMAFSKGNQFKGISFKDKMQKTSKHVDFRKLYY